MAVPDELEVGAAEAGDAHPDERFAGSGLGHRQLGELEPPDLAHKDRLHRVRLHTAAFRTRERQKPGPTLRRARAPRFRGRGMRRRRPVHHAGRRQRAWRQVFWLPDRPPAAPSRQQADSGFWRPSSPVTAAGPRRGLTGFPRGPRGHPQASRMLDQPSGVGQAKPGTGDRKTRNAVDGDVAVNEAASLSTAAGALARVAWLGDVVLERSLRVATPDSCGVPGSPTSP